MIFKAESPTANSVPFTCHVGLGLFVAKCLYYAGRDSRARGSVGTDGNSSLSQCWLFPIHEDFRNGAGHEAWYLECHSVVTEQSNWGAENTKWFAD